LGIWHVRIQACDADARRDGYGSPTDVDLFGPDHFEDAVTGDGSARKIRFRENGRELFSPNMSNKGECAQFSSHEVGD